MMIIRGIAILRSALEFTDDCQVIYLMEDERSSARTVSCTGDFHSIASDVALIPVT